MPLYDFRCTNKKCKTKPFSRVISYDDFDKGTLCPDCGKKAKVIISQSTPFKFDFMAGFDTGTGQWFDSARQRDSYADSHNLRRIKD